jgi:UDP-glucose 4-epimerase
MPGDVVDQILSHETHQVAACVAHEVFGLVLAPLHAHVAVDRIEALCDGAAALEVARRSRGRFVFASSADVYGAWHEEPVAENVPPAPATPYAEAKLAVEKGLADGVADWVALRIATVYGPSEHERRAIPSFIRAALDRRPAVVHGDGSDVRDYVYVGDAAAAIVACCAHRLAAKIHNVGSGTGRSTMDVLRLIASVLGVEPKARFEPVSRAPSRLVLRTAAIQEAIGYRPREDFTTGLREEAEWLHRSQKA